MPGCCLLQVCCPPLAQREALAKKIADDLGWSDHKDEKSTGNARAAADLILDNFDLVPKGVGAAIVAGYAPLFKEGAP